MRVAVVVGADGGGLLQDLAEDGTPAGPVERAADLAAAVAAREAAGRPRWVWAATAELYPQLLAAGVRVERCHDLGLTEGIVLAADGRWGEPRSFPAAWARLEGRPVPDDTTRWTRPGQPAAHRHTQPGGAGRGVVGQVKCEPGGSLSVDQGGALAYDSRRMLTAAWALLIGLRVGPS